MNIKRKLTGAAAVLLACIAALVFAALVPARAIPPSGGRQYRGIDISEFQGEIDFEEVRRSGIEAVYIRVGAGEYTDEYFAENYERAKAAGLNLTLAITSNRYMQKDMQALLDLVHAQGLPYAIGRRGSLHPLPPGASRICALRWILNISARSLFRR